MNFNKENYKFKKIILNLSYFVLSVTVILLFLTVASPKKTKRYRMQTKPNPRKFCLSVDQTLKARHKSCFLRPDTGPCRSDIIQWYYDVRQERCYRFYWGGCQGNGNKFESMEACLNHCQLNTSAIPRRIPYFCSLSFDYGSCFGYFHRWAWDVLTKSCRRRLYSGCGGNQNNFQSKDECMKTCLNAPNNTIVRAQYITTCIPIPLADIH